MSTNIDWNQVVIKLQHSDALISDLINSFDSDDQSEKKQAEILLIKSIEQLCQVSQATKGTVVALLSLAAKYKISLKQQIKSMEIVTREDLKCEINNISRSS